MTTSYAYAEAQRHFAHINRISEFPLSYRQQLRGKLAETMAGDTELICDRMLWLLQGCYGYHSQQLAREIVSNKPVSYTHLTLPTKA